MLALTLILSFNRVLIRKLIALRINSPKLQDYLQLLSQVRNVIMSSGYYTGSHFQIYIVT